MPPDSTNRPIIIPEKTAQHLNEMLQRNEKNKKSENLDSSIHTLWGTFDQRIKWANSIGIITLHLMSLYYFLTFDYLPNWKLVILAFIFGTAGGVGVTAGAHRYFTHKCFKAKTPLRIILMILFTSTGQNTLFNWVRDHRVHHKFSETSADPHNAKRGFFFSHCGWLMLQKHPDVLSKGKVVDCSDLLEDPVVRFHQKYFLQLKLFFAFFLPTFVPWYFFNYAFMDCFKCMLVCRYCTMLNCIWSVNSAAHLWGNKPYDKTISPVENKTVSFLALGEGWHNYHHTFPWDYRAAEHQYFFNITTMWIDLFAAIGWAYDLKQPSNRLVESVVKRDGDGSHFRWGHTVIAEEEEYRLDEKTR